MPDFPIVDTHVHFIDVQKHRYPEIAQAPSIHKTHLPEDFDRRFFNAGSSGLIAAG